MKARHLWTATLILTLIAVPAALQAQAPLGTAFSYQGHLKDGGLPYTGTADIKFMLFDDLVSPPGIQVGQTLVFDGQGGNPSALDVENGLFTAKLDFGTGIFTGDLLCMEIEVRTPHDPTDTLPYTALTPRQELNPTPNSIYASAAGSVSGGITGSGTGGRIARFTGGSAVGNSEVYQNSQGRIGILAAPYWGGMLPGWGPDLHVNTQSRPDPAVVWIGGSLSTDGDEIGQVAFVGEGAGPLSGPLHYAAIKGEIVDSGSMSNFPAGLLSFHTATGNTFGIGLPSYSEQMRIENDGEVGMGTSDPKAGLHLHRPVSSPPTKVMFRLTTDSSGANTTDGIEMGFWTDDSPDAYLHNWENGFLSFGTGGGAGRMRIMADGKVGIGTITPQNLLDVDGAVAVGANYSGTNTAPGNGMIVEGNVGIGTSSPQGLLDVHSGNTDTGALFVRTSPSNNRGGIIQHQSSTFGWQQRVSNSSSSSEGRLHFSYIPRNDPLNPQTADVLVLKAQSRVGINTASPTATLDVNGTARIQGLTSSTGTAVVASSNGTLYKLSSSRRYKTDIKDLPVNPDKVLKLRPVSFKWKSTGNEDIGLIAEEVDELLKDLVIYDERGRPDAVKYDRVAVHLLSVVKAQQERIAALEAAVAKLSTRNMTAADLPNSPRQLKGEAR